MAIGLHKALVDRHLLVGIEMKIKYTFAKHTC